MLVVLLTFDWSPYLAGLNMGDLVLVAAGGAMGLAPLVVARIAYRWAFDLVRRMAALIERG